MAMHDFYVWMLLGFFAGLSAGLAVSIFLAVWWIRVMQTKLVGETVAEIMEELGIDDDPEGDSGSPADPEDRQEEWWKGGQR
jgi:hypothetical protein